MNENWFTRLVNGTADLIGASATVALIAATAGAITLCVGLLITLWRTR